MTTFIVRGPTQPQHIVQYISQLKNTLYACCVSVFLHKQRFGIPMPDTTHQYKAMLRLVPVYIFGALAVVENSQALFAACTVTFVLFQP